MSIQVKVLNENACNTIESLIRSKDPSFKPCISVRDKLSEIQNDHHLDDLINKEHGEIS